MPKARLLRANFENTEVRSRELEDADLSYASLRGANFRHSDLTHASLDFADLSDTDFCSAQLSNSDLEDATLDSAELGNADLAEVKWQKIKSIRKANIAGVRNAPEGLVTWALKHGAVQQADNPGCPATPPPQ